MARILIVDDESNIRQTLSRAFQSHGHTITLAEDGREGLDLARRSPPDLILLDLSMPRMDGIEVLTSLKNDNELSDIPVIILTAQANQSKIIECLDAGANDYIVKPFSLQELIARTDVQLRIIDLEKQIRESEAYHRELFERTSDPELVIAHDGTVRQINAAARQLLEIGREDILNHNIHDLVYEKDRREFEVAFSGALDGSDIPIFEVHIYLANGRLLPVDTDLCSVDIHGQRHLLLHLRDIRRRKSAEAQSAMILRHIGDAIFITDQTGIIMMTSTSTGEMTGYPQDELIGLDIAKFHAGEGEFRLDANSEHRDQTHEGILKLKDGKEISVEWTLAAFEVAGEIFYISVVRDLKDRRQAEAQRLEADRLTTLLEIAGGAAHEINQPLTAIMGYAEMSQVRLPADNPAHAHQQNIINAATRISDILKRMQAVRSYQTRPYTHGHNIVDFTESSKEEGAAPK